MTHANRGLPIAQSARVSSDPVLGTAKIRRPRWDAPPWTSVYRPMSFGSRAMSAGTSAKPGMLSKASPPSNRPRDWPSEMTPGDDMKT